MLQDDLLCCYVLSEEVLYDESICFLKENGLHENIPSFWDSHKILQRLAKARQYLDIAHQELNEKNDIIDGLIRVFREWEN